MLDYGRRVYRPPAPLAGAVTAAYQTSVRPGSSRPARDTDLDLDLDLDHTIPHGRGGPTSYLNRAPLDRRWHGAKTHGRYRYTRDPTTDRIIWTTPLGQQTTIDPYEWRLGP
jgi:hypothetical protein